MKTIRYNLLVVTILMLANLKAQSLINTGNLIQGGLDDGAKLVRAYAEPINKAIVFGMANGTYTKIEKQANHRLLLGLKLANVAIPSEDMSFDVSKLGLEHLEAKDPNKTITRTILGDSLNTITLVSKNKDILGRPLFEFNTLDGSRSDAMPLPMLNAAYRMDNTTISVDIIPHVKIPETNLFINMVGVHVQQDAASFIKSLADQPFAVSLQLGYSMLAGKAALAVKPDGVYSPITITGSTTGPYDNQELNILYTNLDLGAFADYTFSEKYTLYGGLNYNLGSSRIKLDGRYPIYTSDPTGFGSVVGEDVDNPLNITDNYTRVKLEIGAQVNWERAYLQLDYTLAQYGGLGFRLGYKLF